MKILLIMDPGIPVPPPFYGGHERLVAMFANEYEKMGHEVTLLAGPNSKWLRLKTFGRNGKNGHNRQFLFKVIELFQVWHYLYCYHNNFNLIHNFGRLLYLIPILNVKAHKIMTYGRDVTGAAIRNINLLPQRNLVFTGCSNYCVRTGNTAGTWQTVYNAIDFSKYTLKSQVARDSPLMFLGRIESIKGVHIAVKVAKKMGRRLWIAGNIEVEHQTFFKQEIEPFLDEYIIYLGALNDEQKNFYLGQSQALLFPIEWDEPFGMVMVEAMACGTPVIAFPRGAVPEVVEQGKTGFIVADQNEMMEKINDLHLIDRKNCRILAQRRFDVGIIANEYLSLVLND